MVFDIERPFHDVREWFIALLSSLAIHLLCFALPFLFSYAFFNNPMTLKSLSLDVDLSSFPLPQKGFNSEVVEYKPEKTSETTQSDNKPAENIQTDETNTADLQKTLPDSSISEKSSSLKNQTAKEDVSNIEKTNDHESENVNKQEVSDLSRNKTSLTSTNPAQNPMPLEQEKPKVDELSDMKQTNDSTTTSGRTTDIAPSDETNEVAETASHELKEMTSKTSPANVRQALTPRELESIAGSVVVNSRVLGSSEQVVNLKYDIHRKASKLDPASCPFSFRIKGYYCILKIEPDENHVYKIVIESSPPNPPFDVIAALERMLSRWIYRLFILNPDRSSWTARKMNLAGITKKWFITFHYQKGFTYKQWK
ncbi:MAG: hypothetical protein WC799_25685 [Desulfobacteraceae bacterium]